MDILLSLTSILVLAMFCQWLAWRCRLPAILFLLLAGISIGPFSTYLFNISDKLLDPELIFGKDLLYPMISVSVAIILFEGSMTLKFNEFKEVGRSVTYLVTIGLLLTIVMSTLLARITMGFSWQIAALLGSITSVSGPTVVVPILKSIRPSKNLSKIIRWEGMLIDPIGAFLSAIVLTAISGISQFYALQQIALQILQMIVLGVGLGIFAGYLLGFILSRHLVPEFLCNLLTLSFIVGLFTIGNYFSKATGLAAVTAMGVMLGNMKSSSIEEVVDFKEHLSVLLISALFIILSANLTFARLEEILLPAVIFILSLQFIVRPTSVFICTYNSGLSLSEKILLSWVYPRGIVVAAVAALFSAKLINDMGMVNEGDYLSTVAFLVIIGTVLIQSITAPFLAKILKVSVPDSRGFLIIGANKFAREIAKALKQQDLFIMLADINWQSCQAAQDEGLPCYYGSVTSEQADWHLDMIGIGRILGLSGHDHLNTLSAVKYAREFGTGSIFLLPASNESIEKPSEELNHIYSKRFLPNKYTYSYIKELMDAGAMITTIYVTTKFLWEDYKKRHQDQIVPLFAVTPKKTVHVLSPDVLPVAITPGHLVILLFIPKQALS